MTTEISGAPATGRPLEGFVWVLGAVGLYVADPVCKEGDCNVFIAFFLELPLWRKLVTVDNNKAF
jgi:hypothetical protein